MTENKADCLFRGVGYNWHEYFFGKITPATLDGGNRRKIVMKKSLFEIGLLEKYGLIWVDRLLFFRKRVLACTPREVHILFGA